MKSENKNFVKMKRKKASPLLMSVDYPADLPPPEDFFSSAAVELVGGFLL